MSEQQQQKPSNKVRIGGLWKKEGEYGPYYSGLLNLKELVEAVGSVDLERVDIQITKARELKTPNSPGYNVFVFKPDNKGQTSKPAANKAAPPASRPAAKPAARPAPTKPVQAEVEDEAPEGDLF